MTPSPTDFKFTYPTAPHLRASPLAVSQSTPTHPQYLQGSAISGDQNSLLFLVATQHLPDQEPSPSSTNMDQSPAEIVDLIVYNVAFRKGEHIPEYSHRERTKTHRNADLKAVRLCSKALALAATPLLFADLLVFMNLASFEKLLAIANQAELCRLVRHVTVFPRHFQDTTFDKDGYQYQLEQAHYGCVYKRYHETFDNVWQPVLLLSAYPKLVLT